MGSPVKLIHEAKCQIYLVRHGKAAPKNVGLPDFERILTKTGMDECERVAVISNGQLRPIDLMISSPADRALDTAHLFARHWKYPVRKIRIVEILYGAASIRPIVALIRSLGQVGPTVAVCGHNPLLNGLAAFLIPGFSEDIAKSAVLGIEFETTSWDAVSKSGGRLLFFLKP